MDEGNHDEGYADVGGDAPPEGGQDVAPPGGGAAAVLPVGLPPGNGPDHLEPVAENHEGGGAIGAGDPELAVMLQQIQVLPDGQQATLGRLATLEHNPGPQQAQPQQPPQQHPNYQHVGGALAGGVIAAAGRRGDGSSTDAGASRPLTIGCRQRCG